MPSSLAIVLPSLLLLGQVVPTQPTQPTQQTPAQNRPTQPTQSTTLPTAAPGTQPGQAGQGVPQGDPQDSRTTRESSAARDPAAEADQRTTRDAQFDPRRVGADRMQEARERASRVQRNQAAAGLRVPLVDAEGNPIATGGVDYILNSVVVGGYNSNVQQTQDVVGGPVTKHPALFTGVAVTGTRRSWITAEDPFEISVTARGQNYFRLDDVEQPADGSILATAAGTYAFHPKTLLAVRLFGITTTLNASRMSDGPLLQIAPGSLQRWFSILSARVSLDYLRTARWRYRFGADLTTSITHMDRPIDAPNGFRVEHRGFDYMQPGVDAAAFYDLDWRNTVFGQLRYSPFVNMFLIDFTSPRPSYLGDDVIHIGELTTGLIHTFNQNLTTTSLLGGIVATPPNTDPDQRWILSPRFAQEVAYTKPLWSLAASIGYTYGSVSPRLGFGPTLTATTLFRGTPIHRGNWSRLTFLFATTSARAAFRLDQDTLSRLTYILGNAQVRYSLTDWLGVLGGYELRYTTFEGLGAAPDFTRHIFFLGLSGYFRTDRTLPTIETFVPPLQGG
jgi:hypothetical protein